MTTYQHPGLVSSRRSDVDVLFEGLWAAHGRLVWGLCRLMLRDPDEAEDATQQAFLNAYRSLVSGVRPLNASAWLATIARRECWARTRARANTPQPVDEIAAVVSVDAGARASEAVWL